MVIEAAKLYQFRHQWRLCGTSLPFYEFRVGNQSNLDEYLSFHFVHVNNDSSVLTSEINVLSDIIRKKHRKFIRVGIVTHGPIKSENVARHTIPPSSTNQLSSVYRILIFSPALPARYLFICRWNHGFSFGIWLVCVYSWNLCSNLCSQCFG